MRILFWNILHGGGTRRTPEIALALLDWAAEVIVLCEFRTTLGGQLRGVLADHGWEHQVSTDPPEGRNGLLVASKLPIERVPSVGDGVEQRLIGVRVVEHDVLVLGAHVPPLEAQDGEAQAVWKCLLQAARDGAEGKTLVIGDLNAGRRWQDEAGVLGTRRLSKEDSALQRVGTECMGRLWLMGYRDWWREHKGPSGARGGGAAGGGAADPEFSWFSHEGRGVRIDHALVSARLAARVGGVRYEHWVREERVSDHAALVVEISAAACF